MMTEDPVRHRVLPAHPGFTVWFVHPAATFREGYDPLWMPSPVIGWVVDEERPEDGPTDLTVEPLLPGDRIGTKTYAIERPDGSVSCGDDWYGSLDEARDRIAKDLLEERERAERPPR